MSLSSRDYLAAVASGTVAAFVTAPVMTVLDYSIIRMQYQGGSYAAGALVLGEVFVFLERPRGLA